MSLHPDSFDASFSYHLGRELRDIRARSGLSIYEVASKLPKLSGSTLGAYESGARRMSVARLAELCDALGKTPENVVRNALAALWGSRPGVVMSVDLRDLRAATNPSLFALRRWASVEARHVTGKRPNWSKRLTSDDLTTLATVVGMPRPELLHTLRLLPRTTEEHSQHPRAAPDADPRPDTHPQVGASTERGRRSE